MRIKKNPSEVKNSDAALQDILFKDSGEVSARSQVNISSYYSVNTHGIDAISESCKIFIQQNISEGNYNTLSKIISSANDMKKSSTDYFNNVWNNEIMSFSSNLVDCMSSIDPKVITITATIALGSLALQKLQEKTQTDNMDFMKNNRQALA